LEPAYPLAENSPTHWADFRGGFFEPVHLFKTPVAALQYAMPRYSGAGFVLRGVNMADPVIPVLIPRRRVTEITGLERSALYERIARGAFPQPVRIGSAAVRWVLAEVVEWVQQQIDASREQALNTKRDARR
jgi:prophage regulatory protein